MFDRLRAAAAALVLLAAAPAAADDAAAIRGVIGAQLEAFRADDWAQAYSYASPSIQRLFRSPSGFANMVKGGYPMVWRPSRVEVGALEQGPQGPVQMMFFEDAQGNRYVAAYEMQQIGGVWRINGVRIQRAPDASV
jgi:hypothetical protein